MGHLLLRANRPLRAVFIAARDPTVWTGGALQVGFEDMEVIGLAELFSCYLPSKVHER